MKAYTQTMLDNIRTAARTELITLELAQVTLRYTTAGHDIVFQGDTYLSNGNLLALGGVKQQQELRVNTATLQLSAVDQTVLALFQAQNQSGRRATLRHIMVDDNDQPIGTALLTTTMRIDSYTVDDGDNSATMAIELSNYLAQFDGVRGIRTTQESYQRFYPTSTSFINSKSAGDDLKWGGK